MSRNLKGIPDAKYICSTCKQLKDSIEFHWYEQTIDGRGRGGNGKRKRVNGSCKDCRSKLGKQTAELKKKILPIVPKPTYGELCGACKRPVYMNQSDIPSGVDGTYAWMFDHNHKTVQFRGWICNPCNTGFGLLGDTADSVKLRLKYLIESEQKDNEEENPFARNEAYIEHRKEFPYYPDKPKEEEGVRRGRETAEYLKSLGWLGGKKDKENADI